MIRWCDDDRMGIEFDTPLECDQAGGILALRAGAPSPVLRKSSRAA